LAKLNDALIQDKNVQREMWYHVWIHIVIALYIQ